jgi:hypothetical protein
VAKEEKTRKAIFARGKRLYRLSGSVQVSICEQLNGNDNSVPTLRNKVRALPDFLQRRLVNRNG